MYSQEEGRGENTVCKKYRISLLLKAYYLRNKNKQAKQGWNRFWIFDKLADLIEMHQMLKVSELLASVIP